MNGYMSSGSETGVGGKLLIPVDFSEMCDIAIKFGFEISKRLSLSPVILNASAIPLPGMFSPYQYDFGSLDEEDVEMEEMMLGDEIHENAEKMMEVYKNRILKWQEQGLVDNRPFQTEVTEGMPEEVILEYCKTNSPHVVVMATRGIRKKEEELVGSVTAEVLDNIRTPLFALPENYTLCSVKDIVRLVAICSLEGQDSKCVDSLMEMFGEPKVEIWLVPLPEKNFTDKVQERMESIREDLSERYRESTFHVVSLDEKDKRGQLKQFMAENDVQMIIVPNKKKNIFARLFNPGIAHRILFEKDIPLLALPV